MNLIQKVAKNTTLLIFMQVVVMILGLIFTAFIARDLGASDFGIFSFALSFTSLFALVVDVGFNQLITREFSRDKSKINNYIGNVVSIKLILGVIYFLLIFVLINFIENTSSTRFTVYLFAIYIIFASFIGLFKGVFNSYEDMEYTSFITIIEKIIIVSIGISLLYWEKKLIYVVLAYPIGGLISVILCAIIIKKYTSLTIRFDFETWKNLINDAIPFGIFSIFLVINYRVDTVMLSFMKSDYDVGLYNAAYTLVSSLSIIPISFIGALFPLLSRISTDSKDSLGYTYEKSLKYLLLIAIPIVFGTIILADKIILTIYGKEYTPSILALQILVISIIPVFMHNVFGAIILALNKEKSAVFMWGGCSLINIILNYMLIPVFSLYGASFTTVISETVICIQFYYFVSKHLGKISIKQMFYKPLLGSLLMSFFLLLFNYTSVYLLIPIGAIIYLLIIVCVGTFPKDEKKLFNDLIGK